MPIFGHNPGPVDMLHADANTRYMRNVTTPEARRVPKLSMLVDGLDPLGSGDGQPIMGLIYDSATQKLVAKTAEVVIPVGAPAKWIDLVFPTPGGVVLPAGTYRIGFIAGAPATARFGVRKGILSGWQGPDTYGPVSTTTTSAVTLPVTELAVTSTTGFDPAGVAFVAGQEVHYTSKEATKLKGVTGGLGAVPKGAEVFQSGPSTILNQPSAPVGLLLDLNSNGTFNTYENTGEFAISSGEYVGPTAGKSTVWTYDGTYSVFLGWKATADGANAYFENGRNNALHANSTVPGRTYTLSRRIYNKTLAKSGAAQKWLVQWISGTGGASTVIKEETAVAGDRPGEGKVGRVTFTGVCPPGATRVVGFFGYIGTLKSGDEIQMFQDQYMVEEGAIASPDFPLEAQITAGTATWLGEAHNSESRYQGGVPSIFATYFVDEPTPAISDIQIGRYPFSLAQAVFGEDPPVEHTSEVATVSWHGTLLNPERGSFVLVQRGGRLSDLLGERVRISTFDGRSVNAYVLDEAELEDDLSLTRRCFMALGLLSADNLNVRVEVLSSQATE